MREIKSYEEFMEVIKNRVLVDFYADWCGPCRMLGEVLKNIESELDIEIVKVNVDQNRKIAMKYGVMSIPSLKVFNNGKIEKEKTGFMREEELKEFLA
jgi:thioredoxin 1